MEDSIDAIENVEKAGFENVNLDRMFMIPRQTVESWVEDLGVPYRPMYSLMRRGRIPE